MILIHGLHNTLIFDQYYTRYLTNTTLRYLTNTTFWYLTNRTLIFDQHKTWYLTRTTLDIWPALCWSNIECCRGQISIFYKHISWYWLPKTTSVFIRGSLGVFYPDFSGKNSQIPVWRSTKTSKSLDVLLQRVWSPMTYLMHA